MHYRDTILEINMDNCFHNLEIIKNLNPNKKIIAVVKANAYGHGMKSFCLILEKYNKIDSFAVATLDEGIKLRLNGIKKEILVLGAVSPEYFDVAFENNIQITCYNLKNAEAINKFNNNLKVHIKVDTGMNRIGINNISDFENILELIDNSNSEIVGVFTHLSSADTDCHYTKKQIDLFKDYYEIIKDRKIEIHVQNTGGIVNNSNLNFVTAIRPGLIMYGHNTTDYGNPDFESQEPLDLKELISLKSKVVMVKDIPANCKVGYDGDFITKEPIKLATLPIGYADGYKMAFRNLFATKDGIFYNIRGKICMDQLMIEVDEKIQEEDFLYLINNDITAKFIAKKTYTSIYEMLTSFSNRLFREFYVNDVIEAQENIF